MNIEIAISTLNDGIHNLSFRDDFNYLIIHQITNNANYSESINKYPGNVRYIASSEKGLSKSRNLALKNTKAKYLWIMDDDVTIKDHAKVTINNLLKENNDLGMLVVSHSHLDILKMPGNNLTKLNIISAARVSSIDMIINMEKTAGLLFNEDFGLGTKKPSGEEYIFTCQLINKGLTVLKSNDVCSYHPLISSGLDFYSTYEKLKAKLDMFKSANGNNLGKILFALFIIKKGKLFITNGKARYNLYKILRHRK